MELHSIPIRRKGHEESHLAKLPGRHRGHSWRVRNQALPQRLRVRQRHDEDKHLLRGDLGGGHLLPLLRREQLLRHQDERSQAEENRNLQEGRWLRVFDRYLFKEDTDDESFIEMIWYRFFIVFHNDELKLYKQTVIC